MNRYFETEKVKSGYFSDAVTSVAPLKDRRETAPKRPTPATDASKVFDKFVTAYGEKRSGVVIRRYGIK